MLADLKFLIISLILFSQRRFHNFFWEETALPTSHKHETGDGFTKSAAERQHCGMPKAGMRAQMCAVLDITHLRAEGTWFGAGRVTGSVGHRLCSHRASTCRAKGKKYIKNSSISNVRCRQTVFNSLRDVGSRSVTITKVEPMWREKKRPRFPTVLLAPLQFVEPEVAELYRSLRSEDDSQQVSAH